MNKRKQTATLLLLPLLLSVVPTVAGAQAQADVDEPVYRPEAVGPVIPPNARKELAAFVDPTASIEGRRFVTFGEKVYIAPFANVLAGQKSRVSIGNESDLQDNTVLDARINPITLGERSIIAHGAHLLATQKGHPAKMSTETKKPDYTNPGVAAIQHYLDRHPGHAQWGQIPSFIGFNSIVDGATLSDGSMVTHLCKVDPGIVLKTGLKVLPGKEVRTQEEADNPGLGKVAYLTEGDMTFMVGVVEVNVALARGYTQLYRADKKNVLGINWDPGTVPHNHVPHLPIIGGKETQQPDTGNKQFRIIGDVRIGDIAGINDGVSLRADEGPTFKVGTGNRFAGYSTFHALEGSNIEIGDGVTYEKGALIHGGTDDVLEKGVITKIGSHSHIGRGAVVFKSTLGEHVDVGAHSLVMGSNIQDHTVIPPGQVWIDGKKAYDVEW